MSLEYLAYALLGAVVLTWAIVVIVGLVAAFPFGLIGLVALAGFGLLLIKVLKERMQNKEDDYYNKNVDK